METKENGIETKESYIVLRKLITGALQMRIRDTIIVHICDSIHRQ